MKLIKVLEWNIKGSSSTGWSNGFKLLPEIADIIMVEQKADIFVINEFVISLGWDYFQEKLIENGYVWFINYMSSENGILIAMKQELIDKKKKFITDMYREKKVSNEKSLVGQNNPNFLHVNTPNFNIIGIRIRQVKFSRRKEQLDAVIRYIKANELKNVLIFGDFNNGRIKGEKFQPYDEVKESYMWCQNKEPNDLRFYNYHIIKNSLPKHLKLYTPKENQNVKYSWQDSYNNKYQLDHIISDLCINEDTIEYIWTQYSDHAMLIAEVLI